MDNVNLISTAGRRFFLHSSGRKREADNSQKAKHSAQPSKGAQEIFDESVWTKNLLSLSL